MKKLLPLYLFFILLIFHSCNKAKQLARIQKNHAYLFEKTIDTLSLIDTIYFYQNEIKFDTLYKYSEDTSSFNVGDIQTKVLIKDSIVYVEVFKPEIIDTVYFDSIVLVPRYLPNVLPKSKPKFNWIDLEFGSGLRCFLLLIVLLLVIYIFARIRSPVTNK